MTTAMSTFGRCAAALAGVIPYSVDHHGLCYQERISDPIGAGFVSAELTRRTWVVPQLLAAFMAVVVGLGIVATLYYHTRNATAAARPPRP